MKGRVGVRGSGSVGVCLPPSHTPTLLTFRC